MIVEQDQAEQRAEDSESDFQSMPSSLVFPLIAKFSDWVTRTKPSTFEKYLEVKLPSVIREEREL